jgi:hypothetical protein
MYVWHRMSDEGQDCCKSLTPKSGAGRRRTLSVLHESKFSIQNAWTATEICQMVQSESTTHEKSQMRQNTTQEIKAYSRQY